MEHMPCLKCQWGCLVTFGHNVNFSLGSVTGEHAVRQRLNKKQPQALTAPGPSAEAMLGTNANNCLVSAGQCKMLAEQRTLS